VELMRLDAELGAVRARHDSAAIAVGQLEARLEDRDRQLARLSEEREALDDALFKTRSDIARLERELGETRLAARKDLERAEHDIASLRALRDEMTAQFRQLSDETLRSQGADMRQA